MSEADILEATYQDKMTVYRPFKDTSPIGESVFLKGVDGKKVYEDKLCALSSPTGGKVSRNGIVTKVITEYSVFYRPEIDIQKGDTLKISHEGKEYIVTAGLAKTYVSHNNCPVKLEKEEA